MPIIMKGIASDDRMSMVTPCIDHGTWDCPVDVGIPS